MMMGVFIFVFFFVFLKEVLTFVRVLLHCQPVHLCIDHTRHLHPETLQLEKSSDALASSSRISFSLHFTAFILLATMRFQRSEAKRSEEQKQGH